MTAEGPQAGLTHSGSLIVGPSVIVPALPPLLGPLADMPPVLATACMVGFVEATCIDDLKPFLEGGAEDHGARLEKKAAG
jgi:fluoroacetyl-CoA thioesterase